MHVHERLEMINQSIWHISAWVITYFYITVRFVKYGQVVLKNLLRNIRVSRTSFGSHFFEGSKLERSDGAFADDITIHCSYFACILLNCGTFQYKCGFEKHGEEKPFWYKKRAKVRQSQPHGPK